MISVSVSDRSVVWLWWDVSKLCCPLATAGRRVYFTHTVSGSKLQNCTHGFVEMLQMLQHFEKITFHRSAVWFHQAGPWIPTYIESISTLEDLQFTALSHSASKCCTTMKKKKKKKAQKTPIKPLSQRLEQRKQQQQKHKLTNEKGK